MDDNLWQFDSELSDNNIYVYTIEIPGEDHQEAFMDLVDNQDVLEIYQNPAVCQEMGELSAAPQPVGEQTTLRPTTQAFPAAGKTSKFPNKLIK